MKLIHKLISVLLVSMILWAGHAHAEHVSFSNASWESQDCKLCQSSLDSPAIPSELVFELFIEQDIAERDYFSVDISSSRYLLSPHRGPPNS